jgi:hypothetical protein
MEESKMNWKHRTMIMPETLTEMLTQIDISEEAAEVAMRRLGLSLLLYEDANADS